MCSPEVMANVHEAVTRRRFLGRLGAAGAASALGLAALAPSAAAHQVATPAAGPLAASSARTGRGTTSVKGDLVGRV